MWRGLIMGAAAGAVGTVALNLATYSDMLVRGRAASDVPSEVAGLIAEKTGLDLAPEGEAADDDTIKNRKSGLGALMGFGTGLGIGTAYGLLRPALGPVSTPIAGVVLGAAAMAASDIPSTALGATDPSTWGMSSWAADIVPHLAYGILTAMAYDAFTESGRHA